MTNAPTRRSKGVALAEKLDISQNRLNEIIRGKRGVTADTALRLSKVFKTSPEFWMNLQTTYELYQARQAQQHALHA
jgi:addiction module HigA family antidote